jgi:hypothetical protein
MIQATKPTMLGAALATPPSRASLLYARSRRRGRWGQVWSAITGQSRALVPLKAFATERSTVVADAIPVRSVPIEQIGGSANRSTDFDRDFYPIQDRTRSRWLGIATAREDGVELPPVSLVRVDGEYFVRDGHHRISVARALGEQAIEARVAVWRIGRGLRDAGATGPLLKYPPAPSPVPVPA